MMNTAWCKISGGGAVSAATHPLCETRVDGNLIGPNMDKMKRILGVIILALVAVCFASPAWAAAVSASKSTVVASPTTVVADGVSLSTITITLKSKTNVVIKNVAVTLTAGSGSSIITIVNATTNNSGQAFFTVTDTVVQSVTYTAKAGGVTLNQKPTVRFVLKAPTVTKSFSPTTIAIKGTSTFTITLTNPNAASITGAAFTDTFPASLVSSGAATTTCAGGTATAGGTNVTLGGATIPASGSCTVTVTVTSATASAGYANSIAIGAVTSTNAAANTVAASATLVVTGISAANSTVVASPTTVLADGVSISTITVTLYDGAAIPGPVSGKTVTLTAGPGSSTITTVLGVTNASGQATFTVKDATIQAVTYTAKDTSDSPNIVVTQPATVTFVNTAILKSFSISSIDANGTCTLTVQLTNSSGSAGSGFGFTDTYPAGLVNAGNASELAPAKCGAGALTGTTGGNTLVLASTTIPATSTCTVSVLVTSAAAGTYSNTATNTSSATSTASLVVNAISAINSTVSAIPASVPADGTSTSTITVTLKDGAATPNTVPGKTVTLTAGSGSSTITTVTGVTNAFGQATFTVKDSTAETISYTATDTTDSIPVTTTASVIFSRLTAPMVTKSFNPSTIADNGTSTLTVTLANSNTAAINGVAFTDVYPTDTTGAMTNISPLVPSNTCGGINPNTLAGGNELDLSGGTIPASGSCSVSVQVTAVNATSAFSNLTSVVTSSNATSGSTASATLTDIGVDPAKSKVVAVPTSVPADNITTSTITVTLLDGGGNPVSDDVVTLAASGGSSTITATCTGACTTAGTTDVNGQATFTVRDGVVQSVTYTATTIDPILITITQQATVTFGTALSGVNPFNAFDTGTLPGATTGYITTKISGASFALDVVALTSAPAVFTGFTGTVQVELVDSSSGACATYSRIQLLPNQTFVAGDNGRHNIASITEPNAWKNVRLRVSYPPTSVSCSTDNFAIRPDSLSVSVTDADWQTAGITRPLGNITAVGGNVHKAGQPFTVQATAVNAAAATTTNYIGTPVAVACVLNGVNVCNAAGVLLPIITPACNGTACVGTPNNITLGAAVLGVINLSTTYSEVGAFTLQLQDKTFAAVDSAGGPVGLGDGTPADCTATGSYVCSAAMSVGRFVPDHFDVTTLVSPTFETFGTTDASCSAGAAPRRTFTYIGQMFGYLTAPQATIYARNAAGTTTANYAGTLWKIGGAAPSTVKDCLASPDANTCQFTTSWSAGGNGSNVIERYTYLLNPVSTPNWDNAGATQVAATVTAGAGGTGIISYASSDTLAFLRNTTTPQPKFTASITDTISVQDTSEVTLNGTIATTTAAAFNGIGSGIIFDGGGASNGTEFRYGRLKLSNALGSELLNLPIPIQTQYWDGIALAFVTNAADNCTTLTAANITLGNYQGGISLANMDTPTGSHINLGGAFGVGVGKLVLTKPSPTPTSKGGVDVTVNLTAESKTYLQGAWTGATYNQNPSARATFGVYKGANEFIYLRENY
jgi:hypothetical protein